MVQRGVIGGHCQPLPQDVLTCLVPPLRPVEIRQIHIRRRKRGIDPQRRPVGLLGFRGSGATACRTVRACGNGRRPCCQRP